MMAKTPKFVSYLRVSTDKQGQSGLGLEAQREACRAFMAQVSNAVLVHEFIEVETGKHNDRAELANAMAMAKAYGATLLIAKLDRLSRDAHFLIGLERSGVNFVACDNPQANRLTIGILALVAEQEREAISQRTKAALAAYKARGGKLGNPNGAQYLREGRARWLAQWGRVVTPRPHKALVTRRTGLQPVSCRSLRVSRPRVSQVPKVSPVCSTSGRYSRPVAASGVRLV